jgi:hypothetical protein
MSSREYRQALAELIRSRRGPVAAGVGWGVKSGFEALNSIIIGYVGPSLAELFLGQTKGRVYVASLTWL